MLSDSLVYSYSLALAAICRQQQRINFQTALFKLGERSGDDLEQLAPFTCENPRVSLSGTFQAVQAIISDPHQNERTYSNTKRISYKFLLPQYSSDKQGK